MEEDAGPSRVTGDVGLSPRWLGAIAAGLTLLAGALGLVAIW